MIDLRRVMADVRIVCFTVYDADNDGLISREELHRVLCSALQDKKESELLFIVLMIFKGVLNCC